ncbi:MAG: hypothetical protein E6F99_22450 [Actinobacteria bacterium]|nr:MAG: hypothetical protein E6F99_22450 [Actinomycetota bacterium]
MSRPGRMARLAAAVLAGLGVTATGTPVHAAQVGTERWVTARLVAVGVPDASAVSAVGTFLPGGPIHDNPAFAAHTQPGRILDPGRILVASRSNFGAPNASPDWEEGALLSIDPRGGRPLAIPPRFAASGGQASTLEGRVQLFSSQSGPFRNGNNNPLAVTATFTGVSNPVGLSINNAFGRLWPANAPNGLAGIGSSTILDPTGIPLAGAPNPHAGGVFAGNLTPRLPAQLIPGALARGAVGTAFLGRSPDGSGRAVFCVVLADGSIVQEHTEKAVDGLAPLRTVSPVLGRRWPDGQGVTVRVGVIVNYRPSRTLYVSEPFTNTVAAIDLHDNGLVFQPGLVHRIRSAAFDEPVDLAPAAVETSDPNWSSNTTLEEGADFYVANRGNNTIVRVAQDGTVVAARHVRLPGGGSLRAGRLNGIAVSPDGRTIWVTVTGPPGDRPPWTSTGAVLQLPGFGADRGTGVTS